MKTSLIFVHYSNDDIKSYTGLSCLYRLRHVQRLIRGRIPSEVIVVNNGTRDEEELKQKCDIYIQSDKNSLGHARNLGFQKATGDYVCFLDNDIFVERPFWGECMEFLETHKDRKLLASPIYTTAHLYPKYDHGELDGWRLNTFSGSNCLMMHRDTYTDIGGFPEIDGRAHDGVVFARTYARKGYVVALTRIGLARDVGMANWNLHYGHETTV